MTILLIIAGIIALVLVLAAISGKDMTIEREITVDRPAAQVFDFVSHIKNHEQFSVWHMMDPDMKKEYRGTDGQTGFVYAWDSSKDKNVGAGEQKITKIVPGERVEFLLRFLRPMQNEAQATMITTAAGSEKTRVQWIFSGTMKFPMNIMKSVFAGMLGKQLAQGLTNLKAVMEKQ